MNDPDFDPYLPPRAPIGTAKKAIGRTDRINGSPWVTIWTQPRATIRGIVDTDPTSGVLLLAILWGINSVMNNAVSKNSGDFLSLPVLLVTFLVGGVLGGLLWLYLIGGLLSWTSGRLGGRATYVENRAAMAWGVVPQMASLVLLVSATGILGLELFQSLKPGASPLLAPILIGLSICQVILGIWSIVTMCKCIGEVNQFSAWKGLGAIMLAGICLFAIVLIIVVAVVALAFALKQ